MPANVARLDPANCSRAGAHQDARRAHKVAMPMNTLEHRAVRDSGRSEDDVSAGEIRQHVFALEIRNAEAGCARTLLVVAKNKAGLNLTSDAAQCRGRQNTFGGAALPHIDIDAGD